MKNNERPPSPENPEFEPRKGLLRLTDPDLAPSVRGVIVILIVIKMITLEALKKGYDSLLLNWVDGLASFGFAIALLMLGMLMWRKYGEPRLKKRSNQ